MNVTNLEEVLVLIGDGGVTKNIYAADPNVNLSKKGSIVFKPVDKIAMAELKNPNLVFLKI